MTERPLVVARRTVVADDVVALVLRDPGGADLPAWDPGAHVDVRLGPDLVRQYSLCGDPADRSGYRVAVLREPASRGGSVAVHALAVGDIVPVSLPRNSFSLNAAPAYLFLAGGVGVTPILPMARQVAASGAPWRFVYGGRSRASMAFLDELPPGTAVHPQDSHGLLPLADELAWATEHQAQVWCCGPGPLLDAVEAAATTTVGADRLHVERFRPADDVDGTAGEGFTLDVVSHGLTLLVPCGRTTLEVLEEAGVPVLFSCREGTCGTCEVRVVAGEVDHRDSLLTPAERAAHDTMFPCVSRALTPRLTIEV